jgi:hypothetical protein
MERGFEKVPGIGGMFFRSRDLKRWHDGIASVWESHRFPTVITNQGASSRLVPPLSHPSRRTPSIRRCRNRRGPDPAPYPNGRFVRLYDPEGKALNCGNRPDATRVSPDILTA